MGSRVALGIDSLREQRFEPLRGKRIGLITNPSGVGADLRATADILAAAPGVKLAALFGPEHGVRGDARAGERVADAKDPATGVPVYSLYGGATRPTAAMLQGLDALVFDLQDIGSRSYTFIYTLGEAMAAAGARGIPFFVLDRPNPLGGARVEGNIPEPRLRSIVCPFPIPYLHGLTVGELARMVNERGWLPGGGRCALTVIPMTGWRRGMLWPDTGLAWVPTSPHIPKADSPLFYAATGIAGELPSLSIGVGYTLPFELAGRPNVSGRRLADALNRRGLGGFAFRPAYWRPFYALFQGQGCAGVQLHLTDPGRAELSRLNFELLDALREIAPGVALFGKAASDRMFDRVCGTDRARRMFLQGRSAREIWAFWNQGAAPFLADRKPYLLYS